jgi:hypothetical protein
MKRLAGIALVLIFGRSGLCAEAPIPRAPAHDHRGEFSPIKTKVPGIDMILNWCEDA